MSGDQKEWGPNGAGMPAGNERPKKPTPQPSPTIGAQENRGLKRSGRLRSGGRAPQGRVCNFRFSFPARPRRAIEPGGR